jgi:hypothetical protein
MPGNKERTAATKKPSASMAFAVAALKKDPSALFATIQASAQKKGLVMIPIIYGRAKRALGIAKPALVPVNEPTDLIANPVQPRRRGPGRPPQRATAAASVPAASMDQLMSLVRESEIHRNALEQIRSILDGVGFRAGKAAGRSRKAPRSR